MNDASHDDDVAVIFDDSDGVDTVACPVTLPSSLDSPSADATDHMFYAVDVCNRFSSLSVENTPVMESSQVTNSTSNIATSGSIADDMSRALHQLACIHHQLPWILYQNSSIGQRKRIRKCPPELL